MNVKKYVILGLSFMMVMMIRTTLTGKAQMAMKTLTISSNSFKAGQPIPKKYSGEDSDTSPHIAWSNAPQETKSFAVIIDDPDAPGGTWVHWVVFNLPTTVHELPEHADIKKLGGIVGKNSWKNDPKHQNNYGGPMPPIGSGKHRYYVKVYALDVAQLPLDTKATKEDLLRAMQGHVLAKQEDFYGTYERTGGK